MGKKERQFAKSQEWLDWLSDNAPANTANATPRPSSHNIPSTPTYRSAPSAHVAPSGRSLGLNPEMFTARSAEVATGASERSSAKRSQNSASHPQPAVHMAGQDEGSIAIRIDLPKFRLPSFHIPWKRVFQWGSVALVVAGVIVATPTLIRHQTEEQKKKAAATTASTPAYAPLKPGAQVSGAQYDSKRKLYKYNDTYKGLTITVSQQPLPENLRANPSKVKELAESLGKVESYESTNGTVYIASGDASNTQRVVVAHRQLLIFLQSNGTLSSVDWVTYVQNLD